MTSSNFLYQPLKAAIGEPSAKKFTKNFGMTTVEDLLRNYPRRYAKRGDLTPLDELIEGEYATVMATVFEANTRRMRNRKGTITEVLVTDGVDRMSLTFFNNRWLERQLVPGRHGLFAGRVTRFKSTLQLTQPEYQLLPVGVDDDPLLVAQFTEPLIPIYRATAGVTSWVMQKAIRTALDQIGSLPDPVPTDVRAVEGLMSLSEAFVSIHRPNDLTDVDRATQRLKFEEAFVLQVLLAQRRAATQALHATRRVPETSPLLDDFDASLPFALTAGQVAVGEEIAADLARDYPMHRLLQGDVGSGKTVVALRAMLRVVDAGGQAALLAPTEVLANQHYESIRSLLGPLGRRGEIDGAPHGTQVALLTGSQRTSRRRSELLDVITGDAGIVIGTHALLQEHVDFNDLALVVVDEQHKFGVEQRAALAAKARDETRPHVLVMTATPIPRSVAMTVFGDVDVSTLTELPAGRAEIVTHVVEPANARLFARIWERARQEVEQGHRVFVVAPRIGTGDESDAGGAESAEGVESLASALAANELAGLRVGILHGRMAPADKAEAMRRFADVEALDGIDVMVATTVVEVGVDVAAATMMVVMDADRFGISQLHQLRGRVGRAGLPGLCILVSSAGPGSPARERLDAVAATTDGFELAERDLELRREGDVLGSAQSGRRTSLRLLRVQRDGEVIASARAHAQKMVDGDPTLATVPPLADAVDVLIRREADEYLDKA